MAEGLARLVCQACGYEASAGAELAFACPTRKVGDDIDHLMGVIPGGTPGICEPHEPNPFVAFRAQMFSYGLWIARGKSDAAYVALVRELDDAVRELAGQGMHRTPWQRNEALAVRYKDETGNVAGSHKSRHLFGIALWVEVAERSGQIEPGVVGSAARPLAIASCGNAALAAAFVARAWGRHLRVFIPDWADAPLVERLRELEAEIVVCRRESDSPPGDPCMHAFKASVEAGALPFTCQGTENGLTIEGGLTLGFEIAQALGASALEPPGQLFIQVGGGALASSTIQALERTLGQAQHMPSIHAVQTAACAPVANAWRAMTRDLKVALGACEHEFFVADDPGLARWLAPRATSPAALAVFEAALRRRSRYMQAIDRPGSSIASGILDDETYDWFTIVRGMILSGGWPVTVEEEDLIAAQASAQEATSIAVSATGAAGLAGLQVARRAGQLAPDSQSAVLFTGVER